jgi:hypothetical protein
VGFISKVLYVTSKSDHIEHCTAVHTTQQLDPKNPHQLDPKNPHQFRAKIQAKIRAIFCKKVFSKIEDFFPYTVPKFKGWRILRGIFPGKCRVHLHFRAKMGKFQQMKNFLKFFKNPQNLSKIYFSTNSPK